MSPGRHFRLSAGADADIDGILDETLRRFGTKQYETYATLIQTALGLVADEPMRPGSKDWNDLRAGLRSFPVTLAAKRRGASPHILFYVPDDSADGDVLVVRVLHQAMDPLGHIPDDPG